MSHRTLPDPYPDEIWYSIVARDLRDWGYVNRAAELRVINGSMPPRICLATPLRPCRLAHEALGDGVGVTAAFVRCHTLIPYYAAFMAPPKRTLIDDLLREDDPEAKLTLGPITRILSPPFVRFCLACLEADLAEFGESYWHRSHQLPGVDRCPFHGLPLYDSRVPYRPSKLDYWAAHSSRCHPDHCCCHGNDPQTELSTAIEEVSLFALDHGLEADLWINGRGYTRLFAMCSLECCERCSMADTIEDALEEFTRVNSIRLSRFGLSGWWLSAFNVTADGMGPLQHIVVREFIRHRLEEQHVLAHATAPSSAHREITHVSRS